MLKEPGVFKSFEETRGISNRCQDLSASPFASQIID